MKHFFVFLCLVGALLNTLAALWFAGKFLVLAALFMWAGNKMALIVMSEKGWTDEDLDGK